MRGRAETNPHNCALRRYNEEKAAKRFPANHASKNKHAQKRRAARQAKQAKAKAEGSVDSANNSAAESGDEAEQGS